jgi:hypothetical protein
LPSRAAERPRAEAVLPLSLTISLVLAAIVLLAFGFGSTANALRFLAGGASLLAAVAATAATVGLFWLGQKNHWTSDGPGMLFVMIALVVCAIVAVVSWLFVFGVTATAAVPGRALGEAPPGVKSVLRLVGFALLAIAAIAHALPAYTGRGRVAHAAPVVAVSFASGRGRLLTLDRDGTYVDWDLHSKRESGRRTAPELAGATEFFVDATAEHAFAIVSGRAVHFRPFSDVAAQTIPDAGHIAPGSAVVVARDRALLFTSWFDWAKAPPREMSWPEPITAIAARDHFVAVADRISVSVLNGQREIGRVPAPGPLVGLALLSDGLAIALDGKGGAWAIDVRRGVAQPLPMEASLVSAARHVFFVSGREVSDYDPRTRAATPVARTSARVRAVDTWDRHVAFGLESGDVVLGTRTGAELATDRLTAKPAQP